MKAGYTNLCAEIPTPLHARVREEQGASGQTLSQYMTWLITTFYEQEEQSNMSKAETRTVAFQVPAETFEQFKEYLRRNGLKQNAFFLDCIRKALREAAEEVSAS